MATNMLFLIGAKGSGKSYIGALLEREMGIPYLRAEPLWKALKEDASIPANEYFQRGIEAVVAEASRLAGQYPCFTADSTGAFDDMPAFIDRFRPFCRPRLIHVTAQPATCLQRVRTRDQRIHINVSDAQVEMVNARSFAVQLPYEVTLNNDPFASTQEIVRIIHGLLT